MEGISFLVSCATFRGFSNIIGNEWKRIDVECDSLFRLRCCCFSGKGSDYSPVGKVHQTKNPLSILADRKGKRNKKELLCV